MITESPKQKHTFTFNAPTAASVLLVGDFTHWQQQPLPLHKQLNGIWTGTVNLGSGTYHYRFLVDGEWRDDPECTLRVTNPFGSQDNVLVVDRGAPANPTPARTGSVKT